MKHLYTAILAAAVLVGFSGSTLHNHGGHDKQASYAVYAKDEDKAKVDVHSPQPLPLETAVQPEQLNKRIRVQATVEDVCRVKGCWMQLTDGDRIIRVTFRDYGFFVPMDIAGKTVIADGVITETFISEADARHYAEDAGASEEEIEKIVGDRTELSMVADAVLIPE